MAIQEVDYKEKLRDITDRLWEIGGIPPDVTLFFIVVSRQIPKKLGISFILRFRKSKTALKSIEKKGITCPYGLAAIDATALFKYSHLSDQLKYHGANCENWCNFYNEKNKNNQCNPLQNLPSHFKSATKLSP